MAETEYDFGTEMRGYKREEVDRALQEIRRELIKSNTDRAETAKEVARLQAVVDDLQAELDEVGRPTYSGLGTKLEQTLRVAEEQSTRLISQADIDAERLRAAAQTEAQRLQAETAERTQRMVDEAAERSRHLTDTAAREAEGTIARARQEADDLVQEAVR
ncbi:MAG: DivIVA domain-containing protein, partial [Yonghaparkia sp.]|nr:DivIVA domain-containing protein [Microcella sp.]